MTLRLSAGQDAATTMVADFLAQAVHRVAVITGYAGTGKTTLIGVIRDRFGAPIVVTPTGKAALRVTEATGIRACTIHRFIYKAEDDPKTGEPHFVLKTLDELESLYGSIVLVDEASMVDSKVWTDLLTIAGLCDLKIILMGDRFQLPPVSKPDSPSFCALDVTTPFSINLTEVIRQALGSPIIAASMILRSGKPIFEAMKLLTPVAHSKVVDEALRLWREGGALLVHRNATRHQINTNVREGALRYITGTVMAEEPLLVLQNNYTVDRYNGEVVLFHHWETCPSDALAQAVRDPYKNAALEMSFGVASIEGARVMLSPTEVVGKSEAAGIGNWIIRKAAKRLYQDRLAYHDQDKAPPHLHANYGYALTTHKAQGSEWPEVLVVMEPSLQAMNQLEQKRWLYTAITRAKEKCSFVYLKQQD